MKKKPYCLIIDSGLGGLHILAKSRKLCPTTNFLYVADNKNLPYGDKTPIDIENSILQIYKRFKKCYNITCIVLACNTATACAINQLRNILSIPIIGTEPNTKAPNKLHCKKIAILVTPLTQKTNRYKHLLDKNCFTICCENLASKIENANLYHKHVNIDSLIKNIRTKKADSIVLGCTHYNFIANQLKTLQLPVFDSIEGVSKQIQLITSSLPSGNGNTIILTTLGNQKLQNSYINYYKHLLS